MNAASANGKLKPGAAAAPVAAAQPKAKDSKAKKPKARSKSANGDTIELPMLVEIAFTASGILLILVSFSVAAVAFLAGASLAEIFLRTLITVVMLGGVLWLFNWQFSTSVLQGAMRALEEEQNQKDAEKESQLMAAQPSTTTLPDLAREV